MKVIKEETVVTCEYFVAKDGRKFSLKERCLRHEEELEREATTERVKALKHFEYCAPYGDENFQWFYVENEADLKDVILVSLNEDERSYSNHTVDDILEQRKFPLWVVAITDDDGYGDVWSADEILKAHETFITNVKNEILQRQ